MACLWLPQYNKRLWEVVVVGWGWGERRGRRKKIDRHIHIYRQSRYCCFNTSHILYLPSFCLFVWFDSHCLWWFIQTCATCTIKHCRDGTLSLAITNDLEWHIFASVLMTGTITTRHICLPYCIQRILLPVCCLVVTCHEHIHLWRGNFIQSTIASLYHDTIVIFSHSILAQRDVSFMQGPL